MEVRKIFKYLVIFILLLNIASLVLKFKLYGISFSLGCAVLIISMYL